MIGVIAEVCLDLLRHAIPRAVESDVELLETLNDCVQKREILATMYPPKLENVSDVTSLFQVVEVEYLKFDFRPTVTKMLKLRDPENPLLYNARERKTRPSLPHTAKCWIFILEDLVIYVGLVLRLSRWLHMKDRLEEVSI